MKSNWPSRRRWIGSAVSVLGLGALGVGRARQERRARVDDRALRPPGALDEDGLLAACVRCGLCVQACPYATLRLASSGEAVPFGTPYFRAREVPCEMCREIPCVRACPTGALVTSLHDIERARMGRASLSRPEGCYSFTGAAACNSCFKACPLKGRAIVMKPGLTRLGGRLTPSVDADVCTGCGKCEKACIAEVAAITVSRVHGSPAG